MKCCRNLTNETNQQRVALKKQHRQVLQSEIIRIREAHIGQFVSRLNEVFPATRHQRVGAANQTLVQSLTNPQLQVISGEKNTSSLQTSAVEGAENVPLQCPGGITMETMSTKKRKVLSRKRTPSSSSKYPSRRQTTGVLAEQLITSNVKSKKL